MKKAAVIIGVDKTGDLPKLRAAASGAKEFASWARGQGFDVALLTDDGDAGEVTLSAIKKAVRKFVSDGIYGQLVVFFSGHGILITPRSEIWLLSDAPADANAAVDVIGSIALARNSGIPHIIFISDACRSCPNTSRLRQMDGGIIFPNEPARAPLPELDLFYATLPGDPALEVPADEAAANHVAVFTECLLDGLNGVDPSIIDEVGTEPPKRTVVRSHKLKKFLLKEVPVYASNISIKLQQDPDVRCESDPDAKYFAEVQGLSADPPASRRGGGTRRGGGGASPTGVVQENVSVQDVVEGLKPSEYFAEEGSVPVEVEIWAKKLGLRSAIERLVEASGRAGFETGTGFSILGTEVAEAYVTGDSGCDVFEENSMFHIRNYPTASPQSVVIRFKDGSGTVLAVLPEFIGTVVVEEDRIVNVSYTPSQGTSRYHAYQQVADELEKRRAFVAVAARNGAFAIEPEKADSYAGYIRVMKGFDPTLGLYAAYAYAESGALDQVKSVYEFMRNDAIPVLFDVALLAGQLQREMEQRSLAPCCPMMRQGWSLLKPFLDLMPEPVVEARNHLAPALWTTLLPKGVDILVSSIQQDKLL